LANRGHLRLVTPPVLSSKRRVSFWTVILLGIIEGVTEFLPVSSTGHLLLAESWLKLPAHPSELFNVVIQSGAVVAVILVFGSRLRQMARDWRTPAVRDYALKLGTAFLITSAGGLTMKKLGMELGEDPAPVAWATLIGGVIILLVERLFRDRSGSAVVTWPVAIVVGLAQLLAAYFPGTSRSGATIIMALMLGLSRPAATEFSFLLGVPTLLAAGGYKVLSALRTPDETHEPWSQIILGTIVSAITAFLVVKWLLRYVQSHTFVVFGWYRIALGGLILGFLVFKT
jgi:undecaprenyl-diphosphatase